ncbi:MAG: zinc ribbon domain-containing protein [Clostridia bacterium]|nr:zinc ribbon domain-containing protein [Clostridia bacterium]
MFCKNCGNQIPDGVAFCAACGTAAAPAAPAAEAAPAANPAQAAIAAVKGNNTIKLIAVVAAIAIVLGLFIGLLGGGSAKSVAKKYVEAQINGDTKAMYGLMAGKMQKYVEEELMDDYKDEIFDYMEEQCDEMDIKAKVNNFNQYYAASKKLNAAQMKEQYGKGYKVKIEVREVENMRSSELEELQDAYDSDALEDYINADKIKKGKIVTVKVIIDGKEDTTTEDITVYVVKYKGKWKVADM